MAFVGIYIVAAFIGLIGAADYINDTKHPPIVCDAECERLLQQKRGDL